MTPKIVSWLWIGWGLIWLAAAPFAARTQSQLSVFQRLGNLAFVIIGGVMTFATPASDSIWSRGVLPPSEWRLPIGVGMTMVGLAFAIWARIALGRMWSGRITLKEDHVIVERGPYGIVRHPIYTGLTVALLGTALARNLVLTFVGVGLMTIGWILKLKQEERLLEGHFGAAYADYRGRVKGLIPWLW